MNTEFVHLHLHTNYSLLDGIIKIPELVDYVKINGQPGCAITDHGNMMGAIDMFTTCKDAEIVPIIGCEFYIITGDAENKEELEAETYHIILLAKNNAGYQNLMSLNSFAAHHFYRRPRIDLNALRTRSEGLICLSACAVGELYHSALWGDQLRAHKVAMTFKDIFGEDYYIELQQNNLTLAGAGDRSWTQIEINDMLREIAASQNIKCVATCDAHYLKKDHSRAQEIALAIATNKTLLDPVAKEGESIPGARMTFDEEEYFVRTRLEMMERFEAHELDETLNILDKCSHQPLDIDCSYKMPAFKPSAGLTNEEFFNQQVEQGYTDRYGQNDDYKERLIYEVGIIKQMGFIDYFLMISDMMHEARRRGIYVGHGRGSAAGSIVCYCLKITNICPIRYGLLFERFLNPERVSMPDIDLDFEASRRDEMFKYLEEKYGEDHIARIITYINAKAKLITRDVFRVYNVDINPEELTTMIEEDAGFSETLSDLAQKSEFKEKFAIRFRDQSPAYDPVFAEAWQTMRILEGNPKSVGQHACGLIVTPGPVEKYVPLSRVKGDAIVSQYAMDPADKIGLMKIDVLSIDTLDIIHQTVDLVKATRGLDIDPDIEKIDLNDEQTFSFLRSCTNYQGLFQMANPSFAKMINAMKPDRIEDIMVGVALFRPGPLRSGVVEEYVKRKANNEKATHDIEEIVPILEETYGLIVYQEQIQKICQIICGWTYGRADKVRKVIGKKKLDDIAETGREFKEAAYAHSPGIPQSQIDNLWAAIEKFGKYGFNQAHSACYGALGYQTAWLKTHFTVEFMAATLTSSMNKVNPYEKMVEMIEDMNELSISLLPPDINSSRYEFYPVEKTQIRFGLCMIKNIGIEPIREIINARQNLGRFKSLTDFLMKVNIRVCHKKVLEFLIKAGTFDEIEGKERRNILLASLNRWIVDQKEGKNGKMRNIYQWGLMEMAKRIKSDQETPPGPRSRREAATIADFKFKTDTSETDIQELISQQVNAIGYTFQAVKSDILPRKLNPAADEMSYKHVMNKLREARKNCFPESMRRSAGSKLATMTNRYKHADYTNRATATSDLVKYKYDEKNKINEIGLFLIFGFLISINKGVTRQKNFPYHNVTITDGPTALEMKLWGGHGERLLEAIEPGSFVIAYGGRNYNERFGYGFELFSLISVDINGETNGNSNT